MIFRTAAVGSWAERWRYEEHLKAGRLDGVGIDLVGAEAVIKGIETKQRGFQWPGVLKRHWTACRWPSDRPSSAEEGLTACCRLRHEGE